ncbi:neurotransmitter-gated ion-channel ligand binding domain-containing protein [Ditylenchus destructor]|uniref:Gamma-aminobutyric acid receptor subunit beta n=1 Tax=Ditylenchus destructor TaxID=166010 RepID=A0AAD4MGN2_9BILA|nr:neurotransmitter-gated ion-channel ligand binding domain-containing protein [Ditylenchus destructor]
MAIRQRHLRAALYYIHKFTTIALVIACLGDWISQCAKGMAAPQVPNLDVYPKSDKEIEYNTLDSILPSASHEQSNHPRRHQHADWKSQQSASSAHTFSNSRSIGKHAPRPFAQSYDEDDDNRTPKTSQASRELEKNVSKILDALIASHDRRIRPNYGGAPTEVNVSLLVITISAVSEVSMDYTIDLYIRQFWRDPRLAFDTLTNDEAVDSSLTVGIDMVKSIWVPDTFFPNEKKSFFHETTSHNSFLRIDNHGNVIRSIRLTVTANCPMNLHTFPLDVQVCALEVESYGYSTNDIVYRWHHTNPVTIDENVHLAHFTIGDHFHMERVISLSTGNYSRLSAYFTFKRNIGFYLIQIYFPSSLIVVISWVSFFLNREATQARVTIGVTTVLTQTTLMTSTNASLPKVSYVKSLDIFLGVCFFIVFASLLEYAAVGFLMKRQKYNTGFDGKTRANSSVCYYELDEVQSNALRLQHQQLQATQAAANATANQQAAKAEIAKKRKFSKRSTSTVGELNGIEQAIPLLSVNTPNHTPGRMSILIPSDALPGAQRRSSSYYSVTANWYVCRIRPSQVDFFSRIAFPTFFIVFHFVYWSVYLNVT